MMHYNKRFKNIKIDIVYTWVNNNDIEWSKKKNIYLRECNMPEVNSDCRYKNNDELRYALRSLEKYANWINKVYIVTDNQIPEWLDINHPKIKIIDHKEIIPEKYLPVFNSNAIEHCICDIPNLSEYYLYGNDDMFFGDTVSPDFFYHKDGYPYCRFGVKYNRNKNFYSEMCARTDDLIEKKFGRALRMFSHHNINAFRKSDVKKCKELFQKEIEATVASRFREVDNVEQTIYKSYALAVKHGHYKGICRLDMYLPIYKNKTYNYFLKKYQPDYLYLDLRERESIEYFKSNRGKIKLFCLNDGEGITDEQRIEGIRFLDSCFPEKSGFEK